MGDFGPINPNEMSAPPMEGQIPLPTQAPAPAPFHVGDFARKVLGGVANLSAPTPLPVQAWRAMNAPPPGAPPPITSVDPNSLAKPPVAPASMSSEAPPQAPPLTAPPGMGPIRSVHSGGGEHNTVGPRVLQQMEKSNVAHDAAASRIEKRDMAQGEADLLAAQYQKEDADVHRMNAAADKAKAETTYELHQAKMEALTKQEAALRPDYSNVDKLNPGQHLMLTISAALGGWLQGKGKQTGNAGLEAIEAQIARNTKAAEELYKSQKGSIEAQKSAFGRMMEHTKGNVEAAAALISAAELEKAQAIVGERVAAHNYQGVQDKADMLRADLEDRKLEQISKATKLTLPTTTYVGADGIPLTQAQAVAQGVEQHKEENTNYREQLKEGNKAGKETDAQKAAAKAGMELKAGIKAIDSVSPKDVSKGTTVGAAASKLPTVLPGVADARKNVNTRDAYNAQVLIGIGAAYKLGTSATEPKNAHLVEQLSAPFKISASDSEEQATQKQNALKDFLRHNAEAQGVSTEPTPQMPKSFEGVGAK